MCFCLLFICWLSVRLSVCRSVCLSICPYACLSVCLFVCRFTRGLISFFRSQPSREDGGRIGGLFVIGRGFKKGQRLSLLYVKKIRKLYFIDLSPFFFIVVFFSFNRFSRGLYHFLTANICKMFFTARIF